jgi:hypothetical protein
MTNEEILQKAFKKVLVSSPEEEIGEFASFRISKGYLEEFVNHEWHYCSPEKFIFSHDFAKAFWGEGTGYLLYDCTRDWEAWQVGTMTEDDFIEIRLPDWQYLLQKMVLEEDPIKYLEEWL